MTNSLVYGPVPSRRLGRSLGINNIPPKRCSYSCVYCQLGKTAGQQIQRMDCYPTLELVHAVREKVGQLREKNEIINYLAFVPDGEPTLDINIGSEIEALRALGIKIAVITNASLVWREDVYQDLQHADWVCLKVDAVTHDIWGKINKPHEDVVLENMLEGLLSFAASFQGELTTETMLVRGVNDSEQELGKTAAFLSKLKPAKTYLAIPTRPPAERIKPATEQSLTAAYQVFSNKLEQTECLAGYEGNNFAFSGNAVDDLLSISAVHPMREDAVAELLEKDGAGWGTIQTLLKDERMVELEYKGKRFYARKIPAPPAETTKGELSNGVQDNR